MSFLLIIFTKKVSRHKRGRDVEEGKFLNPREKQNSIKAGTFRKYLLGFLNWRRVLEFLICVGTVHGGYCSRVTVHGGTVHENCFWIFGFVGWVRARADNVFKKHVNNREK